MNIEAMKLARSKTARAQDEIIEDLKRAALDSLDGVLNILDEAIEQAQKQEPVAWEKCQACGAFASPTPPKRQPEQEPVARLEWLVNYGWHTTLLFQAGSLTAGSHDLYTSPPQRQPLTDEQIEPIAIDVLGYGALRKEDMELFTQSVRAIEAAHGIKGEA